MYYDQLTNLCYTERLPCIDPDGGVSLESRAHTFGWHSWHSDDRERRIRVGGLDACIGSTLREHFCTANGDIQTQDINCPYGCVEGACVQTAVNNDEPVIKRVWVTQQPYCQSKSWTDDPQNATCSRDFWIWVDARANGTPEVRIKEILDQRLEYGLGSMIAQYWYGNDRSKMFFGLQIGLLDDMLPKTEHIRVDATFNGKSVRQFVDLTFSKDTPLTENMPAEDGGAGAPARRSSSSSSYPTYPIPTRPYTPSSTPGVTEQCPPLANEKLPDNCRYVIKTRGNCAVANVYCNDLVSSASSRSSGSRTSSPARSVIPPAGYEDEVLTNYDAYDNPFPDTNISDLSGKAAAELHRRAVIGGFPDGQFKGSRGVNRAEAAKFLLLARFGEIADSTNNGRFPDVLDQQWYTKFILHAANKGIIGGYPDGTFRPGNSVNTAEFLKMLALTFDLELNLPYSYKDVRSDSWFTAYAGIAQKYDLFPSRSDRLLPEKKLTRKEVAVAIYQFLSKK